MPFAESLKVRIRKKCHQRCCLCHALGVEIHHILPQEKGGPNTEANAAPLCPTCHETYGANPQKRKFIRESRDFWYEICESRYPDRKVFEDIRATLQKTATKENLESIENSLLQKIATLESAVQGAIARQSSEELKEYSTEFARLLHDLKGPITGIRAVTSFLKREATEQNLKLKHDYVADLSAYGDLTVKMVVELESALNRLFNILLRSN